VKPLGCKVEHSHSYNAEVIMNGAVFLTSLYNVKDYTGRNFLLASYFTHKNQIILNCEHDSVKRFVTFKIIFQLKCAM